MENQKKRNIEILVTDKDGIKWFAKLFAFCGLCTSKSAALRLIEQGGAYMSWNKRWYKIKEEKDDR